MIKKQVLSSIQNIVGDQNYFDSEEDRICYAYDGTPMLCQLPNAVVRPKSVEEISQIIKIANQEKFAIIPRGSGTGLSGGSIPVEDSIVVMLNHWDKILEIDPKNLTILVEPGVVTGTIHAMVEKQNLFYPPDPGSAAICTIGGNVAENAGGIRGLKYGVTKDYVMGLEVVLPDGSILKTGGKCVKDVAGYNLKDLIVGSEGTLGLVTKILLKLIPIPEMTKTMVAYFPNLNDAGEAVSEIIAAKIMPSALEFLDNVTINCVEEFAHLGLQTDLEALLLIEVDGYKCVVDDESNRAVEICKKKNSSFVNIAKNAHEAMKLRAARKIAFSALARVKPTTILEDATVPRSEIAPMIRKINEIAQKYNVKFGIFGHAGDGNLHPTCLTDERDLDEIERAEKAFEEIFEYAISIGGTITGEHGIGISKRRFLSKLAGNSGIETMKKIKSVFDPNGILNPGKIF
jgi:glycolate oxidase